MSDRLVPIWRKRRGTKDWIEDSLVHESEVERTLWNLRKADAKNLKNGMYSKKHKGFEFKGGKI